MRRPDGTHPIYWRTFKYSPPKDWCITNVNDIADVTKGKLPKILLDKPTATSLPYLLIDGLSDGEHQYTEDTSLPIVDDTDSVVVADGSRSGLPLRGISGALGSTLLRYRAKEGYDPNFLYYLLQSLYPFTNTATIGGAVPHLDKRLLEQLKLSLPKENEAKVIARFLVALDDLIKECTEMLDASRHLKSALMQQLFTKGIPGRHKKYIESKWLKIPDGWDIKPLKQLASVVSGFTMGRDLSNYEIILVPYVTVINVQDGFFDLKDIGEVQIKKTEMESGTLIPGDVLMTEGGDRDKLGRGAIWIGEIEPCAYQNHIFRVRFQTDEYKSKLFHYLIQTWWAKRYFYSHAKQTNNLCTINSRELKSFPVGIPDPDEQEEMIHILESADRNICVINSKISALINLKKSLLQNLLTGKVRVKVE